MNSRFMIAWLNIICLYFAGIIGVVAQRWKVGGLVLLGALVLTVSLGFLERWDRRKRIDM